MGGEVLDRALIFRLSRRRQWIRPSAFLLDGGGGGHGSALLPQTLICVRQCQPHPVPVELPSVPSSNHCREASELGGLFIPLAGPGLYRGTSSHGLEASEEEAGRRALHV